MKMVEPVLTWESVSHVICKYEDGRTSATTWESVSNVTGKYDVGRTSDPTWENGNQTGRHDMISATQLLGHGSCNWGA